MKSFRIRPDPLRDARERQVDHGSGVHHTHSNPVCFYTVIRIKLMDHGIQTQELCPYPLQSLLDKVQVPLKTIPDMESNTEVEKSQLVPGLDTVVC